jgi:hypothetical protein
MIRGKLTPLLSMAMTSVRWASLLVKSNTAMKMSSPLNKLL